MRTKRATPEQLRRWAEEMAGDLKVTPETALALCGLFPLSIYNKKGKLRTSLAIHLMRMWHHFEDRHGEINPKQYEAVNAAIQRAARSIKKAHRSTWIAQTLYLIERLPYDDPLYAWLKSLRTPPVYDYTEHGYESIPALERL